MTLSRREALMAAAGTGAVSLLALALMPGRRWLPTPRQAPATPVSTTPRTPPTTASAPSSTPATPAPSTPSPTPTPTPTPTSTVAPAPAPGPAAPTIPSVPSPLPSGVINALVIGTDSNKNNTNTDVLVLCQLSADRQHLTMVSTPRDCYVSINGGAGGRVNAALARSGIDGFKRTMSDLFGGLEIHYIAQTNFGNFIKLSDMLDGYVVDNKIGSVVKHPSGERTPFPKGPLSRRGDTMLYYVRQRKGLPQGDLDRGERHRAVITAMIRLLQDVVVHDPGRFMAIARDVFGVVNVYGGLKPSNVLGLVGTLKAIKTAEVTSLRVPISGFGSNDYLVIDKGRLGELAAGLRRGDVSAYVRAYGTN